MPIREFNFVNFPVSSNAKAEHCIRQQGHSSFNFVPKPNTKLGSTSPFQVKFCLVKANFPSNIIKGLEVLGFRRAFGHVEVRVAAGNLGELRNEDEDDVCPVECVREFSIGTEFSKILETAKETGALVVVDFYRTTCGSCKLYIEQGFSKLCKGAGDGEAAVIFLKHNVIDEYDKQSEVADQLRIKAVPLFHFYKDGVLLEAFPTGDREDHCSHLFPKRGQSWPNQP